MSKVIIRNLDNTEVKIISANKSLLHNLQEAYLIGCMLVAAKEDIQPVK